MTFFFAFLISVAWCSNSMLNKMACLVPDIRVKVLSFELLIMILAVNLSLWPLLYSGMFLLYPPNSECLIIHGCSVLSNAFYASIVGSSAALCWSSREEISHIQGKRNPSKTIGAERASEGRQTETTITEN